MRINYFGLPLFVILSLLLLSACSESDGFDSKKSYEPRSGISGSGKYMTGSGSYRRGNREKSELETDTLDSQKSIPIVSSSGTSIPSNSTTNPSVTGSTQDIKKTVSYSTPGGPAGITFSIGFDTDRTITAVSATMNSGDHESQQYVRRFTNTVGRYVIGKKINSLSLNAVGGSSLTTGAFNKVIQAL